MSVPSGYTLERRWSFTQFLIGIFGATAILGVMAKIFNFETELFGYLITWKPVVLVGFMGEAIVFILMGMMREMRYVPVDEADSGGQEGPSGDGAPKEAELGDETLEEDLRRADERMSQEADQLAEKIKEARQTLLSQVDALDQLATLQKNLEQVNESLTKRSEALEQNIESLESLTEGQAPMGQVIEQIQQDLAEASGNLMDEMAETQRAMKSLRSQFEQAAERFEQFNAPTPKGRPTQNATTNQTPAT